MLGGRMNDRKRTALASVFFKVAKRRLYDLKGKFFSKWNLVAELCKVDKDSLVNKLRNSSDPNATERELQELIEEEKNNAVLKAQVVQESNPRHSVAQIMTHADADKLATVLLSDEMKVTCIPSLLNARITNLSKAHTN